ncbi:hypothetical protein ACHAWF_004787 [Thalassiosira exigua]
MVMNVYHPTSALAWASLLLISFLVYSQGYHMPVSSRMARQPSTSTFTGTEAMNRSYFLKHASVIFASSLMAASSSPSNAIEFVPPSPYFSGSYQDAEEILRAQRIAVDNIASVINDGNLDEAGFKVMQLGAQTRTAGKIILDTFQEKMSGNGDSILLLRFLSVQKKFAVLLDLCDDLDSSLQSALKAKSGGAKAAARIKTLAVVEDVKSAYDDFLAALTAVENAISMK